MAQVLYLSFFVVILFLFLLILILHIHLICPRCSRWCRVAFRCRGFFVTTAAETGPKPVQNKEEVDTVQEQCSCMVAEPVALQL